MNNLALTWGIVCSETHTLQSIFLYLDRTFIVTHTDMHSLWDIGCSLFRKSIQSHHCLESQIVMNLINLINSGRQGEMIDMNVVQDVLCMLASLKLYESKFENQFLSATRKLYAAESRSKIESMDTHQYLNYCIKCIQSESDRLKNYIEPASHKKLIGTLEDVLIQSHVPILLGKGFEKMLELDNLEGMRLLYKLLERASSNAINEMQIYFSNTSRRSASIY